MSYSTIKGFSQIYYVGGIVYTFLIEILFEDATTSKRQVLQNEATSFFR